ncbi:MAG: hypothetical protein Q8P18_21360 [Pseudomonadota bacterium]|nr:hypothetical protein [Pseudomonadota bacterium]
MKLRGEVRNGIEGREGVEETQIQVGQSEWAGLLREMGYRDLLLLEVPIAKPDQDAELAHAAARLIAAREWFLAGRYGSVVQECRHVMEALGHSLGDGTGEMKHLRALLDKPKEMTKDDRLMAIRRGIFVMTCLAAHSTDDVSVRTSWNRHDALAVLTMTASVIQWITEERDV